MSEIFDKAKALLEEINAEQLNDMAALEDFRIKYIGTKGLVKGLMAEMRNVPNELKKNYGLLVNEVKASAETKFQNLKDSLENAEATNVEVPDLSLNIPVKRGSRHPLNKEKQRMIEIFERIGFVVADGPEMEDDWHNFTALNTPEDHPARDMQDTFYIQQDPVVLLRTHTSSAQVHVMENQKPPIRIINPGRVYRNETISARAHCQFHQIEGLYIDKNVSFGDLKQTLLYFVTEYFGEGTKIQLRPSYFPFTEPSAEVDVTCMICKGEGCSVCKYTGWVEILGCGMVDPNVLQNCNIDPEVYSGFAFGMGIDRSTMLKYRIDDIRLFFENDIRFLSQFGGI